MDLRRGRPREILAITAATVFVLVIQFAFRRDIPFGPDSFTYLGDAQKILAETGFWSNPESFQSNYWPMLYSTCLALIEWTVGLSAASIQIFHSVLMLGTVVGVWFIVRDQAKWIRFLTVGFLLLSPPAIIAVRNTGYESLLAFLLTTAITITVVIARNSEMRHHHQIVLSLIAGLSIGLAGLTNPRSLVIGIVIFVFLFRRGVTPALVYGLGTAVPLFAWGLRNLLVLGSFQFLTTSGKINVWIGSNPEATTGGYMAPPVTPNGYLQGTLRFLADDPAKFVELLYRRATFFWGPAGSEVEIYGITKMLFVWYSLAMAIVVLIGFVGWWFTSALTRTNALSQLRIPAWSVLAYFLASLPFLMLTRYRFSIEPIIISVAVPTLAFYLVNRVRNRAHDLEELI